MAHSLDPMKRTASVKPGPNKSIIPILDQNRLLSINIDSNLLINIGNPSKSIGHFLVIMDFDRFVFISYQFYRLSIIKYSVGESG